MLDVMDALVVKRSAVCWNRSGTSLKGRGREPPPVSWIERHADLPIETAPYLALLGGLLNRLLVARRARELRFEQDRARASLQPAGGRPQ